MAGPTIEIQPPRRTPREGGIDTDVAEYRSNDRLYTAEAVVFQSDGCTFPDPDENRCYADAPVADKTYDGIEIEDAIGAPFTLYGAVSCFATPDPDEEARANAILSEGQGLELETALGTWADGGTALTAGANVIEAIGRVEQALDSQYRGRGVILMSRFDAVLADAAGALDWRDGRPYTINGTPVIASGGIAIGTVKGVGAIVVERSEVISREVIKPLTNRIYAVAEQSFVIAVDCEFRVKSATSTP
jgi:hypothetical protein